MRSHSFVELRCKGISPKTARKIIDRRYSVREARIESIIGPPRADEIIPIGQSCLTYAGSGRRYERRLHQIELQIRRAQQH
jgi:hypothetical protein